MQSDPNNTTNEIIKPKQSNRIKSKQRKSYIQTNNVYKKKESQAQTKEYKPKQRKSQTQTMFGITSHVWNDKYNSSPKL